MPTIRRLEQGALGVEHGEQVVGAFTVADFGQPQGDLRLFHDLHLQGFLLRRAATGGERGFDIGQGGAVGFAVARH